MKVKISTIDPATMTAGKINAELDKLDVISSKVTQAFIDAGRGYEKPSETATKSDPLAAVYNSIASRRYDLKNEIDLRYGPGASWRLPVGKGFGPRKRLGGLFAGLRKIDCGGASARFCRERQFAPSKCAPGSVRTVKSGSSRVVICCPRGKWNSSSRRCSVSTKAQSILRPKSHPKCGACRVR